MVTDGVMTVAALGIETGAGLRFFLEFVRADGTRCREPLGACMTARLEDTLPVRSFQWQPTCANYFAGRPGQ